MSTDLDPDPEQAAEEAFTRSAQHEFRGKKLLPFSFRRQAAQVRCGIRCDNATDSLFLIYLCLTPDEQVTNLYSSASIVAWRKDAEDWADREGITVADAAELNAVATAILADVYASDFIARPATSKTGPSGPKTPGQPGKPSTSQPSRRRRRAR